jgi:hypothetical protein
MKEKDLKKEFTSVAIANVAINNVAAIPVQRNISVWKQGQQRVDFQSSANTWGELKSEISSKGFDFDNTRVCEGNTQIDLVNNEAVLPSNFQKRGVTTNDLIIIITSEKKIKSGAITTSDIKEMSYKELKSIIKDIYNDKDQAKVAKDIFGNYTRSTTDELKANLIKWIKKNPYSKPVTPVAEKEKPCKKETKVKEEPKITLKKKSKLSEIQSNLNSGDYKKCDSCDNIECDCSQMQTDFEEAINYIVTGVRLLQGITFAKFQNSLPTDEELAELAKKFQR